VVGYRVYYGRASGSYLQAIGAGLNAGSSTAFTVNALPAGSTYYFVVTSVDGAGRESAYSNEATKQIR
jgi:fibronectin type 3 domain-containing protein